jgi:hypothetical protein
LTTLHFRGLMFIGISWITDPTSSIIPIHLPILARDGGPVKVAQMF